MTRRTFLAAAALSCTLRADDDAEVWKIFTQMAAALGQGNAPAFLAAIDPSMPGFASLRANIQALVAQYDIQSSVERTANATEVDWLLHVTARSDGRLTRRQQRV